MPAVIAKAMAPQNVTRRTRGRHARAARLRAHGAEQGQEHQGCCRDPNRNGTDWRHEDGVSLCMELQSRHWSVFVLNSSSISRRSSTARTEPSCAGGPFHIAAKATATGERETGGEDSRNVGHYDDD